jgi:hypothetical protein
MVTARVGHAAIALTDGRAVIFGGQDEDGHYLDSAEFYYESGPFAGSFVAALRGLNAPRAGFATMMTVNHEILILGGHNAQNQALAGWETYQPAGADEAVGMAGDEPCGKCGLCRASLAATGIAAYGCQSRVDDKVCGDCEVCTTSLPVPGGIIPSSVRAEGCRLRKARF